MTDIILSTQNGEPVASSRDVAKRFGKRHDHVIRDIEELIKGFPKNGDTPMFFKTEYSHPQNHQKYPHVPDEPGRVQHAGDGLYWQGGRTVEAEVHRSLQPDGKAAVRTA